MIQFKYLSVALLLLATFSSQAQVGIGTTTPAASAQLDVSSGSKGFLPPRMTGAGRDAIANPANGLIIYCTDCGIGQINVYNYGTTTWTNMSGTPAATVTPLVIGQYYGGGKIAYILQVGDPGYIDGQAHGLIAAASDIGFAPWGCDGTNIPGADGTALGTGNQNTIDIMAGCSTAGIAARLCGDLVLNGYSDWYLPSIDELSKLYINKVAIGGFESNNYWSSSEYDFNYARNMLFGYQIYGYGKKTYSYLIRAVRSF